MAGRPWRFTPIVFDAYGTLFDPGAIAAPLDARFPGRGAELAAALRSTQLRHTWLRTLIGDFVDFDTVTRQALEQVLEEAGLAADDGPATGDRLAADGPFAAGLLARYRELPPYPDVIPALATLDPDWPLAILTNGSGPTVEATLRAAGLAERITTVLSVDIVRAYKPSPQVYRMASDHFGVEPSAVAFVSGNAWDCAGAAAYGLRTIRVRRGSGVAERVGPAPAATIDDLMGLRTALG
jgi:2-haloacid dehalogenase